MLKLQKKHFFEAFPETTFHYWITYRGKNISIHKTKDFYREKLVSTGCQLYHLRLFIKDPSSSPTDFYRLKKIALKIGKENNLLNYSWINRIRSACTNALNGYALRSNWSMLQEIIHTERNCASAETFPNNLVRKPSLSPIKEEFPSSFPGASITKEWLTKLKLGVSASEQLACYTVLKAVPANILGFLAKEHLGFELENYPKLSLKWIFNCLNLEQLEQLFRREEFPSPHYLLNLIRGISYCSPNQAKQYALTARLIRNLHRLEKLRTSLAALGDFPIQVETKARFTFLRFYVMFALVESKEEDTYLYLNFLAETQLSNFEVLLQGIEGVIPPFRETNIPEAYLQKLSKFLMKNS